MSKIKNYLIDLQSRPEYEEGFRTGEAGKSMHHHPYPALSIELRAFREGWYAGNAARGEGCLRHE